MQRWRVRLSIFIILLFLAGCSDTKPACQKEVTTFEKATQNRELLKEAIERIKAGEMRYECVFVASKYMQSQLDKKITPELLKSKSESLFGASKKDDGVLIKCAFYENDKLDPGKKSQNCKLFAGYLMYEFIYKNEQVYKIQIDVEEADVSDMDRRLECIKSSIYRF